MFKSPLLGVVLFSLSTSIRASGAPGVQWVKTTGGSGANTVVKAAVDARGNLCIVGNTTSLDFPVTAAAQHAAGGSTLVRIHTATGVSDKLYPSGLSTASSIAADPSHPQTIYATEGQAIWRSLDAGSTWNILFQFAPEVTTRFVAVDPTDSNKLYLASNPQGPFKSIDGGLSWTAIDKGFSPARDGSLGVYRIWVDPASPDVIFASATSGLYRSPDAGATWTVVVSSFYMDNTLVFDPFHPGTVFLAGGGTLHKSTDSGQTFTSLSQLPDGNQFSALLADPLQAGVLFAGSYTGIFESMDSGMTWTRKSNSFGGLLAADPNHPALYANNAIYGILKSTDAFNTSSPIGPPETQLTQMLVAGDNLFLVAYPSSDVFAVKLDPDGNIVYSTYFGGSANESAVDMAVGADGSVYITGSTTSTDFPVTAVAYASTMSGTSSNFVFKLAPDGSVGWATYFAGADSTVHAIAVDSGGSAYVGGSSSGGLPTTPGVYQTKYQSMSTCTGFIGCFPGPTSSFVTRFNTNGGGLVFSTYIPTDMNKNLVQTARALAVDASGNTYFGGNGNVVFLNVTGTALLASGGKDGLAINAVALDSNSNFYAAGVWSNGVFPATLGSFQAGPQPASPNLPAQVPAGGGSDAFVVKWDSHLSQMLGATLLGGESTETAESIAIDGSGNIIVSGVTDSKAFPTRAPFQTAFSPRSGFLSILDGDLKNLLFSTYVGDTRAFDARSAVPDSNGNILLAGSTLNNPGTAFYGGDSGASFTAGGIVVANKIVVPLSAGLRLDSVVNLASRLAGPIAPGEAIAAIGSGFGSGAQLVVDTVPLTGSALAGVMPDTAKTAGAYRVQVSSGGDFSNSILVPAAPGSPGIYAVDGSGHGQGYILNSDGTMNSPANPAAPGSGITILATGVGSYTLSGPYAILAQPPAVFIDGFYANGIAAFMAPFAGFPGNVYQISVTVPDPAKLADQNPNLLNFKMPPQVGVNLVVGTVNGLNPANSAQISQSGLVLNVKQ